MKALKLIGFALLALGVLAGVGIAVAAWRFDPAWASQKLSQAVYERSQRVLAIEGAPALSFFPSIGVRLGKVSLSERQSSQEFARADKVRISVRVMPLLSRRVVVDRVELEGAGARIVRDANGRFNFDDLLSARKESAPGGTQSTPVAFDVAGISVAHSGFLFRDEKAAREIRVSDLSVETGHLSQSATGPFQLAFRAEGEKPKLALTGSARGTYRYDLARRQFAVEGIDIGIKGDVADATQLDAAIRAKEAGAGGAGGGGIQVTALALNAKGRLAQRAFEAQVDLPRLAQANQRMTGQDATASIRITGAPLQLDAKLKFSADVEDQAVVLSRLTGELLVAHPQLPMKQLKLPLDASARVDWGKSQAAGEWSTRFDESTVKGKFQVAKFAPLVTALDVEIDRLDVDRYMPGSAAPPREGAGAGTPAAAGDAAAIDLSFLRGLNLKAATRVGSLKAHNLKFDHVAANLLVADGRLEMNPVSADLYGGRLAGSFSAQADGNRVALKQGLSNVAIGPLIRDYARKDMLEGRGNIVLDLGAAGRSAAAMRQSLGGTVRLDVRDGAVKGIDLSKSLRQYKSMIPGGKQDATVASSPSEKTAFSELAASFTITNGVARNDDLVLKASFLRATGGGTIDLARERIDYLARVTIVNSPKAEFAKELAELNGLTVPVRLSGPLESPAYRLEFGELAAELAKQQVRKQLGQQVDKALGNKGLGETLRSLIK